MTDADRSWIDAHVLAFALGALDDADEARFRDAVRGDADFEALLESATESIGHVPAALIARWTTAGRELSEFERSLVEGHLHRCPQCQEELRILGISKERRPVVTSRFGWGSWIGGALIGAAAMAAFLTLRTPEPSALQGERLEVVSPRAMRGLEVPSLQLDADARAFLLAVPLPMDVEPASDATLVLLSPDGARMIETQLGPAPWQPPSTQILVVADPVFESGEYAVQLRIRGEAEARQLGYFRIERPR